MYSLYAVSFLDSRLTPKARVKKNSEAVLKAPWQKTLLARAFRGELGTNDAGEESALELLKSVLN